MKAHIVSDEEVSQWSPKHPRLLQIAHILKSLHPDTKALTDPFLGSVSKFLEGQAYRDRLTTGKNQTLQIKSEALEGAADLSNLIPGKALASIGPIGLRRLGDPKLWAKYLEIKNELGKVPQKDWQLQKEIVESNPGWFAVPRGRDADPTLPHVKFGYEVPEAKLKEGEPALAGLLDSPRHFRAYPDLSEYKVVSKEQPLSGHFDSNRKEIGLGEGADSELLKVLNHELEHYVQTIEGWPGGTSTKSARKSLASIGWLKDEIGEEALPVVLRKQADIADLMRNSRPGDRNAWAHVEYRRAAGEQMAEAAAKSAAKGGGLIPKSYTSTPALMYDPAVQARSILELTRKLDEKQYQKDLADEIARFMK